MPGSAFDKLFDVAADQYGYVTTKQARETGVTANTVRMMAKRGTIQRISRGVYRFPGFPYSPYAGYMEASLWPSGVRGFVSHESALSLYGLSDVSPDRMHITVPATFRTRRSIPERIELHQADLPESDIREFEGIAATTAERAILDCHASHLGPRLLRQAIQDAVREGLVSPERGEELAGELLGPGKFAEP
jgi:predicted transcriptional regulator of viral defense system